MKHDPKLIDTLSVGTGVLLVVLAALWLSPAGATEKPPKAPETNQAQEQGQSQSASNSSTSSSTQAITNTMKAKLLSLPSYSIGDALELCHERTGHKSVIAGGWGGKVSVNMDCIAALVEMKRLEVEAARIKEALGK